jgi:DNA-binding transcriptional ArsR family regulator
MPDDCPPEPDATTCAEYFKALADPIRLQIVKALRPGPMSVSDLALLLECELSKISHHLRVLYHAKLVGTTRDGKYIYYYLNPNFLKRSSLNKALDFGCCKLELRG